MLPVTRRSPHPRAPSDALTNMVWGVNNISEIT